MRSLTFTAPAALLLVLAACAPTTGTNRYAEELRQLSADCEARGGILVASGQHTGRPQTENFCRISGSASRVPGDD